MSGAKGTDTQADVDTAGLDYCLLVHLAAGR